MGYRMKLAERVRGIAEECSKNEIEQALDLRMGFADSVSGRPEDTAESPEFLGQSIATKCARFPNYGPAFLVRMSCFRQFDSLVPVQLRSEQYGNMDDVRRNRSQFFRKLSIFVYMARHRTSQRAKISQD
jgi:hypothetical protein